MYKNNGLPTNVLVIQDQIFKCQIFKYSNAQIYRLGKERLDDLLSNLLYICCMSCYINCYIKNLIAKQY